MPNAIKVGVITEAQGAHLSAYFESLAKAPEAEAVVLADPSGRSAEMAKKALGEKLRGTYRDAGEMLRQVQPHLALVSLPADRRPPTLAAATHAGCHVFAEKPSSVGAADFAKLVRKAQQKPRLLMLALANRTNPDVQEARRLVREGKLGKIYGTEIHIIADHT